MFLRAVLLNCMFIKIWFNWVENIVQLLFAQKWRIYSTIVVQIKACKRLYNVFVQIVKALTALREASTIVIKHLKQQSVIDNLRSVCSTFYKQRLVAHRCLIVEEKWYEELKLDVVDMYNSKHYSTIAPLQFHLCNHIKWVNNMFPVVQKREVMFLKHLFYVLYIMIFKYI